MKRLLLVTAIAAASFAAPAANADTCVGDYAKACVTYSCSGHPCTLDPKTIGVELTCRHPFQDTCDIPAGSTR